MSAPVAAETLAAAARQRLVAHLLTMMGPAATTADATKVLIAGQAWVPRSARRLDAHLREHPDAFVAPSGDCPAVLVRVTRGLARTGHGQVVTQLPQRLNMDVLVALCDIFECTPNDLIEPQVLNIQVAKTSDGQVAAASPTPLRTVIRRPGRS